MENSKIEITEESRMEMEGDGKYIQPLSSHLGKLLSVLKFTGIPITENRKGNKQGQCLDLLQKVFYPIFLLLSCIFLLYGSWSRGGIDYSIVIDTFLHIMPCVMWFLMRKQTISLKLFLAELSKITSQNFLSVNRRLLYSTNAAVCFIFLYPVLLILMRVAQGNEINTFEVFRIIQEAIFPLTMAVLYITISYLLLQKLRYCKQMFHDKLDLTSSSDVENRMHDYLDVLKSVDMFENLLNSIAFVIILHDLCVVTILFIDMFVFDNYMSQYFLEAFCEILYVFVSLSIMSSFAGNLSFEMTVIKKVLLEKIFNQVDQEYPKNNEKRIKLLIKRDVCILTAAKVVVFDKVFVLKTVGFALIEIILITGIILIIK